MRVEVKLHAFLNLALDGGDCSVSCSDRFLPEKRSLGKNLDRRVVCHVVGLDVVAKKISLPLSGIEPGRPTRSQSL